MSTGLRSPVLEYQTLGWSSAAIGSVGVLVTAVVSRHPGEAVAYQLFVGAFFAVWMWVLVGRRQARRAVDAARALPGDATTDSVARTIGPMLAMQAVFAATVALIALVGSPVVGIALGTAAWELATAAQLRRWERRTGRRLLRAGPSWWSGRLDPDHLYAL